MPQTGAKGSVMSKEVESNKPNAYQIEVKGSLDSGWKDWFGALNISVEDNGNTLVTFEAVDQAALHGLLKKVRDSGMTLISVNPITPGRSDAPDI